jgi:hypothetical protein
MEDRPSAIRGISSQMRRFKPSPLTRDQRGAEAGERQKSLPIYDLTDDKAVSNQNMNTP